MENPDIKAIEDDADEPSEIDEEQQPSEESSKGLQEEIEYLLKEITPRALQNLNCEKPSILNKAEVPPIEAHLQDCNEQMEKLIQISQILLTEFKSNSEAQENKFHHDRVKKAEQMKQALHQDSIETLARMQEIKDKHTELNSDLEPGILKFSNKYNEQLKRMEDALGNKDKVIDKLMQEYESNTAFFQKDIERHTKDLALMSDRVLKQLELIKFTYSSQLDQLEQKLIMERQTKLSHYNGMIKNALKNQEDLKKSLYEVQNTKFNDYNEDIANVMKKEEESTFRNHVFLEKTTESLVAELEREKQIIFKRYEIMIYHLDILGLKDSEDRNLYKQARLRHTQAFQNLIKLRTKLENLKADEQILIPKMLKQNAKLHLDITNLEKDEDNMRYHNFKTFQDIWKTTFKEVNEVASKVIDIDRILHEAILGCSWSKPEFPTSEYVNMSPISRNRSRKSIAIKKEDTKSNTTFPISSRKEKSNIQPKFDKKEETRFLRNVLRVIGDCSRDLVETSLKEILKPYPSKIGHVIEVKKIFEALQVSDVKDIEALTTAFRPYFWCKRCSNGPSKQMLRKLFTEKRLSDYMELPQPKKVDKPCVQHDWITDQNFILLGLVEFAKRHEVMNKLQKSAKMSSVYTVPPIGEIVGYWEEFMNLMPPSKRVLWKFLEHAIKHYNVELKKRDKLDRECEKLRRQNEELRHLLKNCKT